MERLSYLYFADGIKTVDFILVYKISAVKEQARLQKLDYFLQNLKKAGLNLQIDKFTVDRDTNFVKVHASDNFIFHYSDVCDIDMACRNFDYKPALKPPPNFMATPLTKPTETDEAYRRAPESVSGAIPANITSAEKILLISIVLRRTKYGDRPSEYGLYKLLKDGIIIDAYPLHDGPYKWTENGPLNDRQLLAKYWANARCWYKEQPLNLIERYYGSEYAFYFAWLGFYVKMLIPAGILSLLCVLYGVATITTRENQRSLEICNSNQIMCPRCHYVHCKFERLNSSCLYSYFTYLFDNPATIILSIVVSFWSTVFMELWQRNEAILQLRWNLNSIEQDIQIRPEYIDSATSTKYSRIHRDNIPHERMRSKIARYTITLASLGLLLSAALIGTIGVMVYRISVTFILVRDNTEEIIKMNTGIIASVTGSLINATFIALFCTIYRKIAWWLTLLENHRTQHQFDHSFIFKSYALSFTYHYATVFYIAFFKGRFYTQPGDMTLWSTLGGLGSDICDPTGCILDLGMSMVAIMGVKIAVSNTLQILTPIFMNLFSLKKLRIKNSHELPIYEQEYLKPPTDEYFLVEEYMDMVIQYGFVVFFVAGFPLAPALALINNLIELRVDATKINTSFRRPVPKKTSGLEAWFAILQAITYVGVVTNALVIAFTSDFVPKEIYRQSTGEIIKLGFTNTTISAYAVKDFGFIKKARSEIPTICFYPGMRFPPDHPQKYEPTTNYWLILAVRFMVVIIFEHLVVFIKSMVAYAIPDVPQYVVEEMAAQEKRNKAMRIKHLNQKYSELKQSSKSNR